MLAKIKLWYKSARENITWHNIKKFCAMVWEEPIMMIIVGSTGAIVAALMALATVAWPMVSSAFLIVYLAFYAFMLSGALRICWQFIAEAWDSRKDVVEGSVVRAVA
jgi:hypothetical protein